MPTRESIDEDYVWEHPEQKPGENYFGNIYPDWKSTQERLATSPVPVRIGIMPYGFRTHEPLLIWGLRPLFCRMEDEPALYGHFNGGVL